MEALWPIIIIVGPILLAAVVLWALVKNRATASQDKVADRGSRELYAEEDRLSED